MPLLHSLHRDMLDATLDLEFYVALQADSDPADLPGCCRVIRVEEVPRQLRLEVDVEEIEHPLPGLTRLQTTAFFAAGQRMHILWHQGQGAVITETAARQAASVAENDDSIPSWIPEVGAGSAGASMCVLGLPVCLPLACLAACDGYLVC